MQFLAAEVITVYNRDRIPALLLKKLAEIDLRRL